MVIGVNCGHTVKGAGCGAWGFIRESECTRLVGYELMKKLEELSVRVIDCTVDEAATKKEYLTEVVKLANREELDLFISIHFNASVRHRGEGVEVYTYKGRKYPAAMMVCDNIARLGFCNRGIKNGSELYVVGKTKARAMLIEVCFCDSEKDVATYKAVGAEKAVARAIFEAIKECEEKGMDVWGTKAEMSFEEVVGRVAKKDWDERKIMLPSVVVAQAMKESARGTSELAREANALFGIKKNGWTGRTYLKAATEQRKDGSYYVVANTEWRAYDNWEQSIIDHNTYLATRSTDGGKTLRYAPIIGCENYVLVCQYLQECGYATSNCYAESLISEYIEKYNLNRFD